MPRGSAFLKEWEAKLLEERNSVLVTARCSFCRWRSEGTVRDTREAYLAHRLDRHPDVRPPARRKRHRPYGQLQGFKSLDDNIANARSQGGAGWAGTA